MLSGRSGRGDEPRVGEEGAEGYEAGRQAFQFS